jgi:hypothetical protein
MLTEKGTLPVGVEYNSETHREFEIREQLVSDSVSIFDDPVQGVKAEKNIQYANLCITAKMIVSIGSIPKAEITPELLMNLLQSDFNEISLAEVRLKAKRESFRGKA